VEKVGKYCESFPVKERMTLLQESCLGTGKTTNIKNHFNLINPSRAVMITSRRLFAMSVHSDLVKETGKDWKLYFDEDVQKCGKLYLNDYLVISIESLHKIKEILNNPNYKYGFLILDEIESLLAQFNSETLGNHELDSIHIFEHLVINADQVIACDGFMGKRQK